MDPLHRESVDRVLRQLRPPSELELRSLPNLAAARSQIEAGLRYALGVFHFDCLGSFGATVLGGFRSLVPGAPIVLYGTAGPDVVRRAIDDAIDGVIVDPPEAGRLLETLRFVLAGNRYVSPGAAGSGPTQSATSCAFASACGWPLPLLSDLPVGLTIVQGGRIIFASRYVLEHSGYTLSQLNKMSYLDLICEPFKARVREVADRLEHGEQSAVRYVAPIRTAVGRETWIEFESRSTVIAGSAARISVSRDVTDRMTAISPAQLSTIGVVELANALRFQLGGGEAPRAPAAAAAGGGSLRERYGLTRRQLEILEHLGTGASNRQIAATLGLSESTVKIHLHRVMRQLGAANRTAAALIARDLGGSASRPG